MDAYKFSKPSPWTFFDIHKYNIILCDYLVI